MANYKFYDFVCTKCQTEFRNGMWIDKNGQPEGSKCTSCEERNFTPIEKESKSSFMINTGGGINGSDWQKGIPNGFKDFLKEFKGRHGRENTIETHASGKTEY